ncbi:hypothetical protein F4779DRAFT_272948 [Xylariaceae sp. FL0662B]|nr:hypothetical protein F4779DRAFT_272948 [Xylariaceae sp. FL0662B]
MKSILAAPLLFASAIIARNCDKNKLYCGRTLLDIGHYQSQIDDAIEKAGQTVKNNGRDDLFRCLGGSDGDIIWKEYCDHGCHDAGHGNNDYCNAVLRINSLQG